MEGAAGAGTRQDAVVPAFKRVSGVGKAHRILCGSHFRRSLAE